MSVSNLSRGLASLCLISLLLDSLLPLPCGAVAEVGLCVCHMTAHAPVTCQFVLLPISYPCIVLRSYYHHSQYPEGQTEAQPHCAKWHASKQGHCLRSWEDVTSAGNTIQASYNTQMCNRWGTLSLM